MLLVMTVEPVRWSGFPGRALPKIRRARASRSRPGLDVWLQVDGGVTSATIERAAEAGADVFVAGSAVYGAEDAAGGVSRAADPGLRCLRCRSQVCPAGARPVTWAREDLRRAVRRAVRRAAPRARRLGHGRRAGRRRARDRQEGRRGGRRGLDGRGARVPASARPRRSPSSLYHLQVLMLARGLTPDDVYAHL